MNSLLSARAAVANGRKLFITIQVRQSAGVQRGIHESKKFAFVCDFVMNLLLQIWREYDTDGSGYIEADELKVTYVNKCDFGRKKEYLFR